MTIVDIYGRVSTQEQAEEGYSIGEQELRLRKFCEAQGWTINRVCMDGGFSGAKLERPALQQVIDDSKKKRIDKVVVYKLDRLSRSQKDTLYLIEDVFQANGVDFVSMTESLDTSTPFGIAMIGILSVFAQFERETIKERMIIGRDARVKEGKYRGQGNPPIGFRYEDGKLYADEYEASVVRQVYERFIAGESANSISMWMTEIKFRNFQYQANKVLRILTQPLYIGRQRYKGEEFIVKDCPKLISDELFYEAQKVLERRQKPSKPQTAYQHTTLLGGMVWCGQCGKRYTAETIAPNRYRYYCTRHLFHRKKRSDIDCKNRSWGTDELYSVVLDELRKISVAGDASPLPKQNISEKEKAITARIETIHRQLDRLIDLYTIGRFDVAQLQARSKSYTDEIEALEAELKELRTPTGMLDKDEARAALNSFAELVDNVPTMDLYPVIHQLIQSITLNGDDVTIQWNF